MGGRHDDRGTATAARPLKKTAAGNDGYQGFYIAAKQAVLP